MVKMVTDLRRKACEDGCWRREAVVSIDVQLTDRFEFDWDNYRSDSPHTYNSIGGFGLLPGVMFSSAATKSSTKVAAPK